MYAVHLEEVLQHDSEILLAELPYRKGQKVDVIVLSNYAETVQGSQLTADKLLHSEIVGLWKDRPDIPESPAYARQFREHAQKREREP